MERWRSMEAAPKRRPERRQLFREKIMELRELVPSTSDSRHASSTDAILKDVVQVLIQASKDTDELDLERLYMRSVSLFIVFGVSGQINWAHGADLQLLEWNVSRLVGAVLFEYIHWKDMPAIMHAMKTSESGDDVRLAVRLRGTDGTYFQANLKVQYVPAEGEDEESHYSAIGQILQDKEVGSTSVIPSVMPVRTGLPSHYVAFLQAGGLKGTDDMSCRVIRTITPFDVDAPYGISQKEWEVLAPNLLIHPDDFVQCAEIHTLAVTMRQHQYLRLRIANHSTFAWDMIEAMIHPCFDKDGKFVGILSDSREIRDYDDMGVMTESMNLLQMGQLEGDVESLSQYTEELVKQKRGKAAEIVKKAKVDEDEQIMKAYSDLAQYMDAFRPRSRLRSSSNPDLKSPVDAPNRRMSSVSLAGGKSSKSPRRLSSVPSAPFNLLTPVMLSSDVGLQSNMVPLSLSIDSFALPPHSLSTPSSSDDAQDTSNRPWVDRAIPLDSNAQTAYYGHVGWETSNFNTGALSMSREHIGDSFFNPESSTNRAAVGTAWLDHGAANLQHSRASSVDHAAYTKDKTTHQQPRSSTEAHNYSQLMNELLGHDIKPDIYLNEGAYRDYNGSTQFAQNQQLELLQFHQIVTDAQQSHLQPVRSQQQQHPSMQNAVFFEQHQANMALPQPYSSDKRSLHMYDLSYLAPDPSRMAQQPFISPRTSLTLADVGTSAVPPHSNGRHPSQTQPLSSSLHSLSKQCSTASEFLADDTSRLINELMSVGTFTDDTNPSPIAQLTDLRKKPM